MTTIREIITPIVKQGLEIRLGKLRALDAPAVTISQVENTLLNPLKMVKMLAGTADKVTTDVDRRKTAIVFSIEGNDNKVIFVATKQGYELQWKLPYQVENIK